MFVIKVSSKGIRIGQVNPLREALLEILAPTANKPLEKQIAQVKADLAKVRNRKGKGK
jgi:hypothetical protein